MAGKNRKIRRPLRYYLQNVLVISVVVLLLGFAYYRNISDIIALRAQVRSLETQIQSAREESSRLDDDLAQIGTQAYIEKIARKYLGLYYPNEKIIVPVDRKEADNGTREGADAVEDTTEHTARSDAADGTDKTQLP